MKMGVHLNFNGNAAEAFAFYAKVFQAKEPFSMTYGQAPPEVPTPDGWGDKILHASVNMGASSLMICDAPPDRMKPMAGFQVAVESLDEAEVRRVYEELKEGGSVQMPMMPTFWSPLFGMCTDKFGVAWMVSVTGSQNV